MSSADVTAPWRLVRPRTWGAEGRWAVRVVLLVAGFALVLALLTGARRLGALPDLLRGSVAALVLFGVSGDALAVRLCPPALQPVRPVLALALGMAAGPLALTVLGILHIPLAVTLPLVLVAGLAASWWVRRRGGREAVAPLDVHVLVATAAVGVLLGCVVLIPMWGSGVVSVPGINPDAHQVVGSAALLQQAPPDATRVQLGLDHIPTVWGSKWPIFYALAAASNLSGLDPLGAFPTMAALLAVLAALGFGALAGEAFGLGRRGGLVVAAVSGLSWVTIHLAVHPYWNQLWGYAALPWALLLGWLALNGRGEARAAVGCGLLLLLIALAYPLLFPYPVVILVLMAVALRRRPRLPAWGRRGGPIGFVLLGLILLVPLLAAVQKLSQAGSQLIHPGGAVWGGDVTSFIPFGDFVGTGGGILPALVILALAVWALVRVVPRRLALALGAALALFALLDVRLRTVPSGTYMDFKHLAFTGSLVVALGATGAVSLLRHRRREAAVLGAVLLAAWGVGAMIRDRREFKEHWVQVPPELSEIRDWSRALPPGTSVRIDIPQSGVQLWAAYFLAEHPVDSIDPVLFTTYAHPPWGAIADYSLALRVIPLRALRRLGVTGPPIRENRQFVLRRIVVPPGNTLPPTASLRQVQP